MENNNLTYHFAEEGENLTVFCCGKLNTLTVRDLADAVMPKLSGIMNLVVDFEQLSYISSAGLRLILEMYKTIEKKNGSFVLRHVNKEVMNIFDLSGLTGYLSIET